MDLQWKRDEAVTRHKHGEAVFCFQHRRLTLLVTARFKLSSRYLCITRRSCSPPPAGQPSQVRCQIKGHNRGELQIIIL